MKKLINKFTAVHQSFKRTWHTVRDANAAVLKVCFEAAKVETYGLLVFALGSAIFVAGTSWVNAQVIQRASVQIANGNPEFKADQYHSVGEILAYLSDSGLMWFAVAFGIFASTNSFIKLLRFLITSNWGSKVRYRVDKKVRDHRTLLDIGRLRSPEYEDIRARIMEQPFGWAAMEQYATTMAALSTNTANLLIFGLGLLFFNPWYALILFLAVSIRAVAEFYWGNQWWIFNDNESKYSRRRGVFATLFSNVIPLYEMKFFGKANVADRHICKSQNEHLERKKKIIRRDSFWSMVTELITALVFICVVTHAIFAAVMKKDVALLVITLDFSTRFVGNLKEVLFDLSTGWKLTRLVGVITGEFFALKPLIPQEGGEIPEKFDKIRIQNVNFSYPGSTQKVLKNINLTFPVGASVAFVGPSGGGKSTLAALLARQYDPTSGSISLDDTPLTSVHPQNWFDYCLCMGQDFAIPHLTILEAICYGKWVAEGGDPTEMQYGIDLGMKNIDMDKVIRACRRANFLEVVMSKSDGFNTIIGTEFKDGVDLSKGENQRLALAARLFAERKLMIFDEPDASLDATSKEIVVEGILDTESTVILVVHNLRACEKCDIVVFVEDGQVAEVGSHIALLEYGGKYAEMYKKQVTQVAESEADQNALLVTA